jgi:hypothetical protein
MIASRPALARLVSALVALPLLACAGSGSGPALEDHDASADALPDDVEPASMYPILEEHNDARAHVSPAADPPLSPLTWSNELARYAQSWASGCKYFPSKGPYGELRYANTGAGVPGWPIGSWIAEGTSYHQETNSCDFSVCSNYPQVIWRDTRRVGCAMANCTTDSPFNGSGEWQFWICEYDPPGNVGGAKPY